MKTGIWHQMGDKSQKLVLEQLENGSGVGVIMSPRDMPLENAIEYAVNYRTLGADVLVDQQFYFPDFNNKKLETYPLNEFRTSLSQLTRINDSAFINVVDGILSINGQFNSSAVIAPAIVYESGRRDIVNLNAWLFRCAKTAAEQLGIPCYATIILGRSVTISDQTMISTLSEVTSLPADGWYFSFEFPQSERIPSIENDVLRFGEATLTLACTGKPVLHAYAGPMGLLSHGFGANAAGVSHYQNTWKFSPTRWQPPSGSQGGGGDAPPRFFSTTLWGTIIYPDEISGLPQGIRSQVVTPSPFSGPVGSTQNQTWSRWDANKHLIYTISSLLQPIFEIPDPRKASAEASKILTQASNIHNSIRNTGLELHDNTNAYQANWNNVLQNLLKNNADDYDYLEAIS